MQRRRVCALLHARAIQCCMTATSESPRRFPFTQVDVFSSKPLEGNPLAVFFDGRGLTDDEMQAIAREMNLSETTFILPRDAAIEKERGVRVRIFTVQEELPFAGHPTLGTAFALRGDSGATEIRLELNVGTVPVQFQSADGEPLFGEMTQVEPAFGQIHDSRTVAEFTGIPLDDIEPQLPIQTVSTGVPFTILPIRGLEAMRRLNINHPKAMEYLSASGGKFFFCVTRETVDPNARLHARMLFYNGEDPATGSASGCAAAWMVEHGVVQPDERVMIEQGVEMKRPSRIFVRASRRNDRVVNVRVGGNVVEVLRGEFFF
jgi:trans-2,3-dihydro-3-hydroxyanthranilate isomerase